MGMDRFSLVLRSIVFFLFPIPFLLGFAQGHVADWTGTVAYFAVAVLLLGALATGWAVSRRNRQP
jgi:hypothetical protein